MSFEIAIRLTEILLAIAFIQQSIEHLCLPRNDRRLFLLRIVLSIALLVGSGSQWLCLGLFFNGLWILKRFDGPYNGGADRMSMLILSCLCLIYFIPLQFAKYIFAYLALQVIFSYFVAGWVKVINREWRSGQALEDIFSFSAFPASESLRSWANAPRVLLALGSWSVIGFELLFPLVLCSQPALLIGLVFACCFHLINIYILGFNRFVWVWLAAYPSVIWFQTYLASF